MAGGMPLVNFTPLHTHSSSFRSRACVIFPSGPRSSTGTQLHSNGAFGASVQKWVKMENLKRKQQRLGVRSEISKTVQQASSASATITAPPDNGSTTLEEMSSDKPNPFTRFQVSKRWRELAGEKNWEGMLNPLDDDLRSEIIRYGEFTQLPYDAFDFDAHSRFCGSCKYNKTRVFEKMGLKNLGYEVTDYIYATSVGVESLEKFFKFMTKTDEAGNEETQSAWDTQSNWIGYVAVTTDPNEIKRLGRRDFLVVWRGTVTKLEWVADFSTKGMPSGFDPRCANQSGKADLKIESGFLQLYKTANPKSPYTTDSARRQVLEAVTRLVRKYADEELSITVTGHSLGSALATITAYDIAQTGLNQASNLPTEIPDWDKPDAAKDPNEVVEMTKCKDVKTVPVTVFSWGGPRVGNEAFRQRMDELGVKVFRVVNVNDVVPKVPGIFTNKTLNFIETTSNWLYTWLESLPWTYSHVGVSIDVDNKVSPYLKESNDPGDFHNLEGYLHLVSGFHEPGKPFAPALYRDIALVNKSSDFLQESRKIPGSWWQEENKGLARTKEGNWMARDRAKEDYPEFVADVDDLPSSLRTIQ